MPTNVIMPQLGESVVEGTVTKWLKQEGEAVKEFEPLLEVNTDKVDTEVPAPASGTVLKLYVLEGTTVKAGTLLAAIGQPGESVEGEPVAAPTHAPATAPISNLQSPTPTPQKELGFISPVVAKIAAEHNVDLTQVQGTGAGGRITKKDVLAHVESRKAPAAVPAWESPGDGDLFRPTELQFGTPASSAPAAPPQTPAPGPAPASRPPSTPPQPGLPDTTVPLGPIRRAVAEHMVRSKHTSPHVTTVMEADLSRVVKHRETHRAAFARDGVNLTFTAYFAAASVAALKAFPTVNSSWSDEGVVLHRPVNIGVAVSLGEEGLIVPVIHDADQKSLLGIASGVNDVADRARTHRLKPDEVRGGTFTITNHGVSGSLFATPIISQPQCAILGVGAIQKRVVVVDDAIAIRPMVYLSLTFDHRILDGAIADYFLAKVVETLQNWG